MSKPMLATPMGNDRERERERERGVLKEVLEVLPGILEEMQQLVRQATLDGHAVLETCQYCKRGYYYAQQ